MFATKRPGLLVSATRLLAKRPAPYGRCCISISAGDFPTNGLNDAHPKAPSAATQPQKGSLNAHGDSSTTIPFAVASSPHDMSVMKWSPEFAVPKNIGRFSSLPEKFLSKIPKISPNLEKQFKLTATPALMFRQSTAELISIVEKEADKEFCTTALVVEGNRGTGKSAAFLQTVSHCHSKGWIIIPVPRLSEWMSGIEPYEMSLSRSKYLQPELTQKFISLLLEWNESALSKIPLREGSSESVADIARLAAEGDPESSFAILEEIMTRIFTAKNRNPVLLAIDQFNALYRRTAYFDTKSHPLTTDRFALPSMIQKIVYELGQPKTVILGAIDHTEPLVGSRYIYHRLNTLSPINQTAETPILRPIDIDISSRDDYAVVLPSFLDPTQADPFSKKFKLHPKHMSKFEMPSYSVSELSSVLDFYYQHNVFYGDMTESAAAKRWMLTQGNPLEVLKTCIAL
ncbi:hypothetical protein BASA50_001015 [Batrachochytrium salamandrivorans]|uniref:Small ribosomal subunit protein mS29 n=1 Tax=Batrachochytrium salamandrivorans TaxID=1357716 RepID=A0ABQ8ES44_9FUNG|nr:hypothetical protein BASA61_007174 [Batrachochytrium salamandrivorans]KAH6585681.1 hypothetical protein BASA50_001015 [Batrachochytrium salamandrivorans]